MEDFNLRLYFKTHLPKKKDKDYLDYLANVDPYHEGHHILGKDWDYLIAKVTPTEHKLIHAKHPSAPTFEAQLLNAINNREHYLEHLKGLDN